MAVLILYAHHQPYDRLQSLKDSLHTLTKNVLPWTPLDIFVFHASVFISPIDQNALQKEIGEHLHIIELPKWAIEEPGFLRNESEAFSKDRWRASFPTRWTHKRFGLGYRRMGTWGVEYALQFAHALGYQYAVKMDDDSAIVQPIKVNLIDYARSEGIDFGYRAVIRDDFPVLAGLAELTRFFLVSSGVSPTYLHESCRGGRLHNLYMSESTRDPPGWDGEVYFGNFLFWNTSYWVQPMVKEYIRLVRESGGIYRHRWTEQPVHTMVAKVFVPKDRVYQFGFAYQHQKLQLDVEHEP